MADGEIAEALDFLSAHPRERFPPFFDPRPRLWRDETTPDLWDVMDGVAERPPAPWVREVYVRKFVSRDDERRGSEDYRSRLARLLPKLPEGPEIAARLGYGVAEAPTEDDEASRTLHELARSAEGAGALTDPPQARGIAEREWQLR